MTTTKVLPTIHVERQYGIFFYWTLIAFGKSFYLGQDEKFCRRVLGMEGSEVAAELGSNNLQLPEVRQKLAEFIIDKLELTEEKVAGMEAWALSAE